MKALTQIPAAVLTIGPATITLFGQDVPVLTVILSAVGLLMARAIAPPPTRPLKWYQHICLTILLLIILFLIVTGLMFGDGTPLGPGMATAWAIGLGLSGLLAIEVFGSRVIDFLNNLLGREKGGNDEPRRTDH